LHSAILNTASTGNLGFPTALHLENVMTSAQLAPALVFPFIVWRIYVRARRNIGRQPLQRKRLVALIVVFSVVTALIAAGSISYPRVLAALGAGFLLGMPVAWLGVRWTKFETTPQGAFYTPNTYLGLAMTLLLVGRIVYRVVVLASMTNTGVRPPGFMQSPLTLAVYGLMAGYYITYYVAVLRRSPAVKAS
jgi:hypothetical protein